ncbi:hypothetical protein N9S00_08085, partial [Luminiphilus sp.]|nr:hypothetical protein [Luminiphilus sp.]
TLPDGRTIAVKAPEGSGREVVKAKAEEWLLNNPMPEEPEINLNVFEEWRNLNNTISNAASAAVAEPIAGIAGIVAGLGGLPAGGWGKSGGSSSLERAVAAIDATRDALTLFGDDPGVQKYHSAIADSFVGDGLRAAGQGLEYVGDKTLEATGSPLLAAAVSTAPIAALEIAGARGLGGAARATGVTDKLSEASAPIRERVQDAVSPVTQSDLTARDFTGTAAQGGDVGAKMAEEVSDVVGYNNDLPYPLGGNTEFTVGQLTKHPDQVSLESQLATTPQGRAIAERLADQNRALADNIYYPNDLLNEAEFKPSGLDRVRTGQQTREVLEAERGKRKAEISQAYLDAGSSPEAKMPVDTTPILQAFETKKMQNFSRGPSTKAAYNAVLENLEAGGYIADGDISSLGRMPLEDLVQLRQDLNQLIDPSKPVQMEMKLELRTAIDKAIDSADSVKYRHAQELRAKFGHEFERNDTIAKFLSDKKNTTRARVADEDIVSTVAALDVKELAKMRSELQKTGDAGQQAWVDLQAQIFEQEIVDVAFNLNKKDFKGNPTINTAKLNQVITRLDQGHKLEFLFGKEGAKALRNVGEVARVVTQAPPGTINYSGTSNAIFSMLDFAARTGGMGTTSFALSNLRNMKSARRAQKEVDQALSGMKTIGENQPPRRPGMLNQ